MAFFDPKKLLTNPLGVKPPAASVPPPVVLPKATPKPAPLLQRVGNTITSVAKAVTNPVGTAATAVANHVVASPQVAAAFKSLPQPSNALLTKAKTVAKNALPVSQALTTGIPGVVGAIASKGTLKPSSAVKALDFVAPESMEAARTAPTTGGQIAAGANIPKEVLLQPGARLIKGLSEEVASGGAPQTITPKSKTEQFLYGKAPIQPLHEELAAGARAGYEAAGRGVGVAPENTIQGMIPRIAGAGYGAIGLGGIKALDVDPGVGGVEKRIIEGGEKTLLKRVGKNLVEDVAPVVEKGLLREGAERVAEKGPAAAEKYVAEQVGKQKAVKDVARNTIPENTVEFLNNVKKGLVDSTAPITDALDAAAKRQKISFPAEKNININIDRALRSNDLAGQFVKDNGLEKAIQQVDDLEAFNQYLVARHVPAVEARGVKTGRDLVRDKNLVESLAPKYEEAAKAVNTYSQKLLDYAVESGLVDRGLAEQLKKIYPEYVPIKRLFAAIEEAPVQGGTRGITSISQQSVLKKLRGSEREIENPLESIIDQTARAFAEGERNKAAKTLVEQAKSLPDFPLRELKKGEKAIHTISLLDNGVKRMFETTPEIAAAAKNLNIENLDLFSKTVSGAARLLQFGATGANLAFAIPNIIKDQASAFILGEHAMTTANPNVFVKALFSTWKKDELYERAVRNAAISTSFDVSRKAIPKTIEDIRAGRSLGKRIVHTISSKQQFLRAIEDVVSFTERLTRVQQFAGAEKALLKKGRSPEVAATLAGRAARENTTNFARRGEAGRVLSALYPYMNAKIQGSRTVINAFKERPMQTTAKLALLVYMPEATLTAWNLSDPKRKAVYDDIADYEKNNNFIFVPPWAEQGSNKRWNILKIPKPPGLAPLSIPVRRAMEQAYGEDPIGFGDIANTLYGTVSPLEADLGSGSASKQIVGGMIPQYVKPAAEAIANYNFFTGLPVVPQKMANLSPEKQAYETTGATARLLGKWMGVSPIKVEQFVRTAAAGVGQQALHYSDLALFKAGAAPKEQVSGEGVSGGILRRFTSATGGELDRKFWEKYKVAEQESADKTFQKQNDAEVLWAQLKQMPKDEANAKAAELKTSNPALYEELKKIKEDEQLGLTDQERAVKRMPVKDGTRARFIMDFVNTLGTKEEKNAYIADLQKKKIVTDEVFAQLKELLTQTPQ